MEYVSPHLKNQQKKLPPKETHIEIEDGTKVKTNSPYTPLESLTSLHCAKTLSFTKPTPIQKHVIPALLNNHAVLCRAPTGMGKTLCFLLPLVERIKYNQKGIQICIVSPIRELCDQIKEEALKIAKSKNLRVEAVYGAKKNLSSYANVDIIIAAPGRLLDLLNQKKITFESLDYFILDEADKLLEMGFEKDIRAIKSFIRPSTLISLFSATYHHNLAGIINDFLPSDRCVVEIENETITNIKQTILHVPNKLEKLKEILSKLSLDVSWRAKSVPDKVLIFVERKASTTDLERSVSAMGYICASTHGDKEQLERSAILSKFRSGTLPILIATSVAARGIDIKDIKLVINYDFPREIKEYIHRIGRTGREGKSGEAITFVDPENLTSEIRNDLISVLRESKNEVPGFLIHPPKPAHSKRKPQSHHHVHQKTYVENPNIFKKPVESVSEQISEMSIKEKKGLNEKEDSEDDIPGEW